MSWPTSVCKVVTARSLSVPRATPKSMIFTWPVESTRILPGLGSRVRIKNVRRIAGRTATGPSVLVGRAG